MDHRVIAARDKALGKRQFRALLKDYPYIIKNRDIRECLKHIRQRNRQERLNKRLDKIEQEVVEMDGGMAKEILYDIMVSIIQTEEVDMRQKVVTLQEIIQKSVYVRRGEKIE